jgi:serine protease AprX
MKFLWSVLVCLLFAGIANAQLNRYVVRFKNKGGSSFSLSNPSAYLSQRAIDRRTKYGIALDSTDLPVTISYITQVRNVTNVNLLNISKWLNAVAIQTTDANAINTITALPFVQSVTAVAARNGTTTSGRNSNSKFLAEEITSPYFAARTENTSSDYFNYGTGSYNEIHLHNGEFLHNIGLRGQGMQIAMLDNGYNNYTVLNSFDSARINNQILGTWDFVNREQNVTNDGSHGMSCFSIIAGNIPGQFIGKAPKASFWLFKTEDDAGEYPIEEFFWACGAERADSTGTDILSSSLGYGYGFDGGIPDYIYSTLNGNTTMSAIAADLAAKKGVMVFVSAGNAGTSGWHFITTPSDGDSVVCVGAVTSGGAVGSFSSYGPSGDGQIKPDLASVGVNTLVQSGSNTVVTGNGTSYACPNMAGLASCLWQAFPEYNNMKVVQALKESASKFTTPDDRVGYGIPNVKAAFTSLLSQFATATASHTGCRITLSWNSKDVNAMKYEIERKAPGETVFSKVGEVNATGSAVLSNKNYQYTNDLLAGSSGSYTYRIKQVIDTATATFAFIYITPAPVTVATTDCPVVVVIDPNKIAISLQPNPAPATTVTLIVETPTAITNMPIIIYDGKGSLVMQVAASKAAGKKTIELPISRLSKGKYYVKVFNGSLPVGVAELIRQ